MYKSLGSPYSPLKVFHHIERLDELRGGNQIVPTQIQLDISDRCNHRCKFCAYRMQGYSSNELFPEKTPGVIPYEKIGEILKDCKDLGIQGIQVTGGGEPTTHPRYEDVFDSIRAQGLSMGLVSNFTKVSSRALQTVAQAEWLRVSIDAGSAETYSQVRRVPEGLFDKVWKNIHTVVCLREKKKTDLVIGVSFVVTRDNYNELIDACKLAKDAGVDYFRMAAMFGVDGANYYEDLYARIRGICGLAQVQFEDQSFRVFNGFRDRYQDLTEGRPDYSFCGYQQFNTFVAADLNVYRCCVLAYNHRGLIGSIKDQSFRQLWTSDTKRKDFENFDARSCTRCYVNNKNRTILYALEKNPTHVEFV